MCVSYPAVAWSRSGRVTRVSRPTARSRACRLTGVPGSWRTDGRAHTRPRGAYAPRLATRRCARALANPKHYPTHCPRHIISSATSSPPPRVRVGRFLDG
eukprot:1890116-Pyramimonas_sp.AAC.1